LGSVQSGDIKEGVVAHKDRLVRFGTEIIEWITTQAGARVVYEDSQCLSSEQELAADLLAIVHVFSCRANGKRRYGKEQAGQVRKKRTGERVQGEDTGAKKIVEG
jgi:predicted site-specific integrase-resolvase